MEVDAMLSALLDLAGELGISVRMMPSMQEGSDHGGASLIRLRGQSILFVDASSTPADQISSVASALRGRAELTNRYLPPELRQLIDAKD